MALIDNCIFRKYNQILIDYLMQKKYSSIRFSETQIRINSAIYVFFVL